MKTPQISPPRSRVVTATTTTHVTVLTTPWYVAGGGTGARVVQDIQNRSGTFKSKAQHRFAAVTTDEPGPWIPSATERIGNGTYPEDIDLSVTTDRLFVQFGMSGCVTTGGGGECEASLLASVVGNGRIVASQAHDLGPTVNSGAVAYLPIGQPFAAVGLTKLMYAVIVSGLPAASSLTYGVAARGIAFDPSEPSAWSTLATRTGIGADEKWNSGSVTVPTAISSALPATVQAGLRVDGPNPNCRIAVVVAAIYG